LKYTIYYGLYFDEVIFQKPQDESGVLYLGSKGFLHFLEAHLGLEGHVERLEHIRTEQYRQALRKYLKNHSNIFYKNSFEADPLACAESLLARRDELLLAGWDFKPVDEFPRLNTLADIEKQFTDSKKLLEGIADRFDAVLQAVAELEIPVSHIFINEPEHLLPPQYKRLFEILRHKKVAISPIEMPKNDVLYSQNQATDLNIFKDFIENKLPRGEKQKLKSDGSIIVIQAARDTDAADYFAQILSKNPSFSPVFLIPDKNRVLDDALIQNGLPSFGLPSSSLGRPTLQLLKLVTTFLWRPIDPYKILEFVTMQAKPLDSDLGTVIANLISQRPGIGSDHWFYETTRFFEDLDKKALDDKNINVQKIKNQYEFWFDRPTYDIEKSAPKDEIIAIFDHLKSWASAEFENSGGRNTSLIVLSEQARRIQEFLEELPDNDRFLTFLELERIIRTIYEPAPIQPRPCELGHYPYFHKESCVITEMDTLAWWNFTDTEGVHFFSRWYKNEIEFLKQNGVTLQSPQDENALMLWQRIRPVLKAKKQIILIAPKKINGKDTVEHPLMSHLHACFEHIEPIVVDIDKNLKDFTRLSHLLIPQKGRIEYHQLGKTQPFIELYSRQLTKRNQETLTSLESLFYYPYQWVFKHKAKLNKSHILSIVKENTLKGNLSHRFFELVLKEDFTLWNRQNVDEWVDSHSRRLFQREAATLMMYGYEPERIQLIRQIKYAIWTLINLIRQNKWTVEGTEQELKGQFSNIPVKGKADIVLRRPSPIGASDEFCILDLKWSGHSYRERLIKNAEDLQLVMYSRLLTEEENWAHTAYFIIENARMLSRNTLAFNEIKPLLPDVDAFKMNAGIWDRMQKTFEWRLAQISEGRIEIRTNLTSKELEEIYGDELIDVLEMKNDDAKFDDFRTLIGLVK
jgi:ATP-dependent helicase/nuclease subunit B